MTTKEREQTQLMARRAIRFVLAWQDMGGEVERLFRILYPTPILAREADPYLEAVAKVGKVYCDFAAALRARLDLKPDEEGADAATSDVILAWRMYDDPWMQSATSILCPNQRHPIQWNIGGGVERLRTLREWVSHVADFFTTYGNALQEEFWLHQKDRRQQYEGRGTAETPTK